MEVVAEFGKEDVTLPIFAQTFFSGAAPRGWLYGIRHDRCALFITTSVGIPVSQVCRCIPHVISTLVMISKRTA